VRTAGRVGKLPSGRSSVEGYPGGAFLFVAGLCAALFALGGSSGRADQPAAAAPLGVEPAAKDLEFFENRIRPLLVEHCQECHGPEKQKGGLRLDTAEFFRKGGDSGELIDAEDVAGSLITEVLDYTGDYKMPPAGKLPAESIEAVREWVRRGAAWPRGEGTPAPGNTAKKVAEFDLAARKAAHWSFQPIRDVAIPVAPADDPSAMAIDRFLREKLTAAGIAPAPEADRRTLLRRVSFDLIGLPPTPSEISEFLADDSPDAWGKVVDRLLASPRYGERWGRHWLDLARFAETYGHEFDFEIPFAYEYRDYVIRALNADVPYDQFVREHVAGDLLPEPRRHPVEGFNESLIGTGFWFLGEAKHSPVDVRADEAERIDNQIDVFGKTFLGLTLGCARCHDHKFDAISTRDYYALCGFIQSSRYDVRCVDDPAARLAAVAQLNEATERLEGLAVGAAAKVLSSEAAQQPAAWLVAAARGLVAIAAEPTADRGELVARAAREAGLPAAELLLWVDELDRAAKTPAHVWHPLANAIRAGREGDAPFWRERAESARRVAEDWNAKSLAAPFWNAEVPASLAHIEGWTRDGDAFGAGLVRPDFLPDAGHPALGGRPVMSSLAVAPNAQGSWRSPTFEIREPFLLYRIAGTGARLNLILDGLQLIQNPIYGGLRIRPDHPNEFRWHAQDVSKWIGRRAYIELIDDGDGWIACAAAIPSASPGAPTAPHPLTAPLLAESQGVNELLERTAALVTGGLKDLAERRPAFAKEMSPASEMVGAWLVTAGLPGTPGSLLVAPDKAAERAQAVEARQKAAVKLAYRRKALCMADGTGEDERVHLRGSTRKLGEVVPRRFMEAFVGNDNQSNLPGSGRLELARRVTDPKVTPLVPRVIVNRLWQHHFGVGLVPTPDDFGNMGRPPTHPELLDYLAGRLIAGGWSLKTLHREMLLTRAYRLSSTGADPKAETADPTNALLHKTRVKRLEGEALRDAMLAVSGRLTVGRDGRGTMPHLTPFMVGRGRPESGPLDGEGRRSIYLNVRRNFLSPLFLAFDTPVPFSAIGRRSVSNVPAQALTLMNNPFVIEQARLFGERMLASGMPDDDARVRALYEHAFARLPTEGELSAAREYLAEQAREGAKPADAWASLAHVLFNAKEFVFVN
jgi:mono/diheme cytochrome c family protein